MFCVHFYKVISYECFHTAEFIFLPGTALIFINFSFLSFTDVQELHWKSNYIFYNILLLIIFIAKAFCMEDSLVS